MDPFYSLYIARRTRFRWEERVREIVRERRVQEKEEMRNDNVCSSSDQKKYVELIFDDSSEEEEERMNESCVKRRRFDDPALGSSTNPCFIDDDDDDDEPVRSRGKKASVSDGYRSNGMENRSVEKKRNEEKESSFSPASVSSPSSSSSSSGFWKVDSPSEEKKKKRQEPSSSSDFYREDESPDREYTKQKKKKMKKKMKYASSDSDSSDLRVSKKRDSKSKEPRNPKRQRRTKRASSSDDDSDGEYEETEAKRAARITRPSKVPKSKAKKKKKKNRSGGGELFKVLVNSMTDAGKDFVEDLAALEKKESGKDTAGEALALKFSFPEKPVPPEKSEFEKEIDYLWTECHLGLASEEIGSAPAACRAEGGGSDYGDEDDEEEDAGPGCSLDLDALCKRGKHQERLDDENGLHCSNCLKTIIRIQDIYPSFVKKPSGRSGYRDLINPKRSSLFDEFGCEDLSINNLTDAELRASAKTVWDMIPGVRRTLYSHQQEGFEFLWKHIAGGIERRHFDSVRSPTAGRGCIISHAPGTGKTLLTIVFLRALMKLHPMCLPVIIAPCSMLLTWGEEFRKWKFDAPFHNLNSPALSGSEYEPAAALFKRKGSHRDVRALKLYSWRKGGSVLGASYATFEKLASPKADPTDRELREILLSSPGLLVLDEGHIPRNESSLIYQVLERVKTRKRILLSGTPFQNNFEELYNTMEMVNPGFSKAQMPGYSGSGNRASQKKAARKDWKDLTKSFGQDASQLARIKALIDPFVHIHRGEVLEKSLPGVKETVVVLTPTELQKTILSEIQKSGKEQLQRQWMVSLISIHPSLATEIKNETFSVTNSELNAKRLNPDHGVKMKFLMGLIRLSDAAKERVLVFSQYLDPLSLVMDHLKSEFGWTENNQVLYIDGKRDMKERQSAINKFNDPESSAKVFLVSTKAGGEGINLVGASRVVLLDVVWNPSVEMQATRRAYRLGQKKFVFIYHLVASGTMEEDKYSRQVTKEKWSKMVFSSPASGESPGPKAAPRVCEDKVLDAMVQHENLKGIFQMIENKNHFGLLDLQTSSCSNSDF